MFSDARMRHVWSDENRTAKYLDIERALAKVQGGLGIIPEGSRGRDRPQLRASPDRQGQAQGQDRADRLPDHRASVKQINAHCRDKLGEYCHWGATTQDITDTATVLQMREGLALVEADLDEISAALAALARKYRDTPIIGR